MNVWHIRWPCLFLSFFLSDRLSVYPTCPLEQKAFSLDVSQSPLWTVVYCHPEFEWKVLRTSSVRCYAMPCHISCVVWIPYRKEGKNLSDNRSPLPEKWEIAEIYFRILNTTSCHLSLKITTRTFLWTVLYQVLESEHMTYREERNRSIFLRNKYPILSLNLNNSGTSYGFLSLWEDFTYSVVLEQFEYFDFMSLWDSLDWLPSVVVFDIFVPRISKNILDPSWLAPL